MPLIDLLDFDLIGYNAEISDRAQEKIDDHVIVNKDDWNLGFCDNFKDEFKPQTARKQEHRCAYCRVTINVDGNANPIEHITPRKLKPYWMFVQHNLVVACANCNSSKGDDNMLSSHENTYGNNSEHCPDDTIEYNIFNPHFDRWSDHFEIIDRVFLKVKPNTKGPFTYKKCGMNRYILIVNYIFQLNLNGPISKRILTQRLRKEKDLDKINVIKEALKLFV
jgi:uncharacterized protein (TIGR02646 family)